MLSWSNISTWNLSFSNLSSIKLSADDDEEELDRKPEPKEEFGEAETKNRDLEKQIRKTKI